MNAGPELTALFSEVFDTLVRETGFPSRAHMDAVGRALRSYSPETMLAISRGLAAGASGDELFRVLAAGRATEAGVREYSEFAHSVLRSDPDEMWAFVRALHHYDIPELAGEEDLSACNDRTKALCRSLLAAVHAVYDASYNELPPGFIERMAPDRPGEDYEPVIIHEGLLDLIRAHPEHGDRIAQFIHERGLGGIETARAALDLGGAALTDGAL